MKAKLAITAVVAALLNLGGCSLIGYIGQALVPAGPTKTVEAEYAGLSGQSIAIVIYADNTIEYEYPGAKLELSLVIAEELRNRLGTKTGNSKRGVDVIDPRRVIKYQEANICWDSMDKTTLGKALGADRVLYVTLVEFATREEGSLNLYRGRILAESAVYDMSLPERHARVWNAANLRVLFPPKAPTGQLSDDDTAIRYETERRFADLLVKKFYKHKVPKNP